MVLLAGLILVITAFINPAPQSIGSGELVYIGLLALMIFIFTSQMLMKPLRIPKSYLYIPILSITALLIVSSWQAIVVNNVKPYHCLRGFIPFLNYLIIFLIVYKVRSLRDLHLLISALLVSALIIVVQSVVAIINAHSFDLLAIRVALPNHVFQPHILASFGFLVGYATETSGKKRLGAILLAMIFLIGMIITMSRSLIILAILMGVAAMSRKIRFPHLLLRWIALGGLILFLLWFVPFKNSSICSALSLRFMRDIRTDVHVEEGVAVLQKFAKQPLLGNGLGFQYSYYRYEVNLWKGSYTHNIILYILLTTGLVGVVAFAWLCGVIMLEIGLTYRAVKKSREQEIRSVFWGLVFCLIITALYSLFQSIFKALTFSIIVSFILVGIVALRKIAVGNKAKEVLQGGVYNS